MDFQFIEVAHSSLQILLARLSRVSVALRVQLEAPRLQKVPQRSSAGRSAQNREFTGVRRLVAVGNGADESAEAE
ncbi:hypothetical protein EYF80_059078 [Liparis tanakae]|uniref:Uncharacterized protein n=1 Tax=Liparis tanakae TaxID=230148 RepID=A0A4Z2EQ78_9TELE|nr:hypothetical protein EYF80_059078 [Liparis tanakae]